MDMDTVNGLDIDLEKEFYYPGESINGHVLISCITNVKIRGIVIVLRGRVQVQWKVIKNGAVYTVKNCHILVDQKKVIWGQDNSDYSTDLPVLKKGTHKIKFTFPLQDVNLPSSFESKLGTIRYYLHTCIDIPYASPPQHIKYFTVIGQNSEQPPHEWLVPMTIERRCQTVCMACSRGPLVFEVALNRTAFCCGETIPLQLEISNGVNVKVWPVIQLIQRVSYYVDKTGLGVKKEVIHIVWEYKGPVVPKHSTMKLDNLSQVLQIPVMPPSLNSDLCDIIQIEYKLKMFLATHKWGEPVHVSIPVLIIPYYPTEVTSTTLLKRASNTVEGGNYISPELQVGQVYDGTSGQAEETIIYQPVYVCVPHKKLNIKNISHTIQSSQSDIIKASGATTSFKADSQEMELESGRLTSV